MVDTPVLDLLPLVILPSEALSLEDTTATSDPFHDLLPLVILPSETLCSLEDFTAVSNMSKQFEETSVPCQRQAVLPQALPLDAARSTIIKSCSCCGRNPSQQTSTQHCDPSSWNHFRTYACFSG